MLETAIKHLSTAMFGKGSCAVFVGKNFIGWLLSIASVNNCDEFISRSIPWGIALSLTLSWYGAACLLARYCTGGRYQWLANVFGQKTAQAASA